MASSHLARLAPAPKPCHLCLTEVNINWKCIPCETYMCDICKDIHLKVIYVDNHKIVDVRSTGALIDIEKQAEFLTADKIQCEIHKRKITCMFCQSCDKLVCHECIANSHKKHSLVAIGKVCGEKLVILKELGMKISQDLQHCQIKVDELVKSENEQNSIYDDVIKKIDAKATEMKNAINQYAQELRDKVETARKTRIKILEIKKKEIEETLSELSDKQDKIQTAIGSNQANLIFKATSDLHKNMPTYSFEALPPEFIDFTPGTDALKKIIDSFGSLRNRDKPHINFDVQNSYTTDLSFVDTVITVNENTAWISNPTAKIIRHITVTDNIKTVKQISVKIYDMAVTKNGELLLSMFGQPDVKLLTSSGTMKPFLSVAPLTPLAIHVTKDGNVLLGVKDSGENYKTTGKSCRKILAFSSDGKEKHSFEHDQHNHRLFTLPYSIETHDNDNIMVIDRTWKEGGRVVVLGPNGDLKWIYHGHPPINNMDKPFDPYDMLCTISGQIIVADHSTQALHVLSANGDVLTYKIMAEFGNDMPNSLDIDSSGQLWVGCWGTKGKNNAKIYIVKFSC